MPAAKSRRVVSAVIAAASPRRHDYVLNRSELLDLMVDGVYARIAGTAPKDGWRATARALARATREAALDHEWFADLLGARPHLGPHALAVGEATAAALAQAPGVRDIDDLQRALGAFTRTLSGRSAGRSPSGAPRGRPASTSPPGSPRSGPT
ncbi:TetR/AcrR family transcriptional regulator C-terminal domain-containing protein [Micromonospora sp. WMMD980]|uniref:TetR/AcrR family transcriptional regulator C-terminal domain-containing protein n=1 Tax=Micromonospora sp. WMMD980 TaxID=3016088 RepID=UPI002417E6D1|nr:TetR/AcrR family transcriptional regulator C-terminal domain-containing protein [Micromonospora sp. WMMD980]MDG4801276.1 TetR/AcrR family transcriptional regulator C-terminal domain-containing protein [Micromonospora sp. WMMD980]